MTRHFFLALCVSCGVSLAQTGPTCEIDLKKFATPDPPWGGVTLYAGLFWSPIAFFAAVVPGTDPVVKPCVTGGFYPTKVKFTATVLFGVDTDPDRHARLGIGVGDVGATGPWFLGSSQQTLTAEGEIIASGGGFTFHINAETECHTINLACGGGSRYFEMVSAHATITSDCLTPPTAVTMYDPVALPPAYPTNAIAGGAVIKANTKNLREVEVVSADGVTRVLVKATGGCSNSSYKVSLSAPTDASLTDANEVGSVAPPGSSTFGPTAQMTTDANGEGYVVYRAPTDYPTLTDPHQLEYSRSVILAIGNQGNNGGTEIVVIRPPVVLVHGWTSSSKAWDELEPNLQNYGPVSVFRFNYGNLVENIAGAKFEPDLPYFAASAAKFRLIHSDLGFEHNATNLRRELAHNIVPQFRSGQNYMNLPAAATQVDIIAHSMGGNLTRTLPTIPGYFQSNTFGAGLVHKLITIATPHLGSPQAIAILKPENDCVRKSFTAIDWYGNIVFDRVLLGGTWVRGGAGDLQGDGIGGHRSSALTAQSTQIPTALIAGEFGNQDAGLNTAFNAMVSRWWCKGSPLADHLWQYDYRRIFDPTLQYSTETLNDGIVPVTSALDNTAISSPTVVLVHNVVHGEGTRTIGFPGPYLLQSPGTFDAVLFMLGKSVADKNYFKVGLK